MCVFVWSCACILFPIEDWCSCQQNQFHQQMFTSNSCMSREFHRYIAYPNACSTAAIGSTIQRKHKQHNVLAKQNEASKKNGMKNIAIAIARERFQIFQLHTIYFNKFWNFSLLFLFFCYTTNQYHIHGWFWKASSAEQSRAEQCTE